MERLQEVRGSAAGGSRVSRRAFLAGAVGTAVLPWGLAACLTADDSGASVHPALVPPRDAVRLALLDLPDPATRASVVVALARRAREQSARTPTTIGLGAAALEGVPAAQRPRALRPMTPFPGDVLDPGRTDAALAVQVEGDDAAAADDGLSRLLDGVQGVRVAWSAAGHRAANQVRDGRALTRNPFGFTEGMANPDGRDRRHVDDVALVPAGAGEPAWTVGGTYLALRVIRLARELWDADSVEVQERLVGRRRDGAWLDGAPASADPDFARDPEGKLTPLDAHVRRANPRTAGTPPPRLVRRSWAYVEDGPGGVREDGLLFHCYQADLETGFLPVQRRLVGQAMDRYLLTVGGGYYLVPAMTSAGRPWEDALFA